MSQLFKEKGCGTPYLWESFVLLLQVSRTCIISTTVIITRMNQKTPQNQNNFPPVETPRSPDETPRSPWISPRASRDVPVGVVL